MLHSAEEYYEVDNDDSTAERFAGEGNDPYWDCEYENV